MQPISLKTGFLAFSLVAIASLTSGTLTACSSAPENSNQTQNTPTKEAAGKQHMGHGSGMNHSMAMDLGPADADYELRFIDAMTPHHQGAVEMAKEAQQKSQRPEIKQLADNIIKAQNQEIKQMKQWRQAWYPKAGDKPMAYHAQMGHMMEMSPEQKQAMMMSMDLGAADAQFDQRFINAMIPHHEGALTMAKDALTKSKRPEIKQMAQDILTSQQKEIDQMKQWQQAWYKK
jgi:Uncharacterized protein conserved in bacteria